MLLPRRSRRVPEPPDGLRRVGVAPVARHLRDRRLRVLAVERFGRLVDGGGQLLGVAVAAALPIEQLLARDETGTEVHAIGPDRRRQSANQLRALTEQRQRHLPVVVLDHHADLVEKFAILDCPCFVIQPRSDIVDGDNDSLCRLRPPLVQAGHRTCFRLLAISASRYCTCATRQIASGTRMVRLRNHSIRVTSEFRERGE